MKKYLSQLKQKNDDEEGYGEEYLVALRLSSLILRHCGLFVGIQQLSDDRAIQQDIMRVDHVSLTEDMEDILTTLQLNLGSFQDYKKVVSYGFKEMISLNEVTESQAMKKAKEILEVTNKELEINLQLKIDTQMKMMVERLKDISKTVGS